MKTMGLFDAKNKLSEVCELVASTREPVTVTRRGRAIVQIIPVESPAGSSIWGTVKESRAKYGALTDEFELPARKNQVNRPDPLS
jgi:prevent-host-death family protein